MPEKQSPGEGDPHRVFLGWSRPFLPNVVDWLWRHHGREEGWDLSSTVVVLPGRRGGRRLLELVERRAALGSPGSSFPAPRVTTPGDLPELLYRAAAPPASDFQDLLAWLVTLKTASASRLAALIPHPPAGGDWRPWIDLARRIQTVAGELDREGLDFADVAALCRTGELAEETRWRSLAELCRGYRERLARQGLADLSAARRDAMEAELPAPPRLVVAGIVDLGRRHRQLLGRLARSVTVLVQAPESESEAFDSWGCLVAPAWEHRRLPLTRRHVVVRDRPRDQALAVAQTLHRRASRVGEGFRATVAVGDAALTPSLGRALEAVGLTSHSPQGRPFSASRPARLVEAAARYRATRRYRDLASLLRHPDVEDRLSGLSFCPPSPLEAHSPEMARAVELGQWITVVDLYTSQTLAVVVGREWPGDPLAAAAIQELDAELRRIFTGAVDTPRPLPTWALVVSSWLDAVYGDDEAQAELGWALDLLRERLREESALDPHDPTTPTVTLVEAVELTLATLDCETVPTAGPHPQVEVLGWLELTLDEAPVVVATGLNEGLIPAAPPSQTLLPDSARARLGLADRRRRFLRDLFVLQTLLESREQVVLIAGRRSSTNDPLTPSRLLLACANEELPRMILDLYDERPAPPLVEALPRVPTDPAPEGEGASAPGGDGSVDEAHRRAPTFVFPHGDSCRLFLARPQPPSTPIRSLPVTAFRDYLSCPYRFYLKWVQRLRVQEDLPREMDGATFGSLAHEVLRRFGASEVASCQDAGAVAQVLKRLLGQVSHERFGARPTAAAQVQVVQLRRRLEAFARWQAAENRKGWRIDPQRLESGLAATLDVDGEPFTVTGRVDRIDFHPRGGCRLVDYKTGDVARSPEASHRRRTTRGSVWIDLQLPLYSLLARQGAGIATEVELGFVHLPRDLGEVGFAPAPWSRELIEEALDCARKVIRCLRQGRFWPPGDPPAFDDGMSWVTHAPRRPEPRQDGPGQP